VGFTSDGHLDGDELVVLRDDRGLQPPDNLVPCIHHLLSLVAYGEPETPELHLPRQEEASYVRPPVDEQTFVPEVY